jgi:hypothetical protein
MFAVRIVACEMEIHIGLISDLYLCGHLAPAHLHSIQFLFVGKKCEKWLLKKWLLKKWLLKKLLNALRTAGLLLLPISRILYFIFFSVNWGFESTVSVCVGKNPAWNWRVFSNAILLRLNFSKALSWMLTTFIESMWVSLCTVYWNSWWLTIYARCAKMTCTLSAGHTDPQIVTEQSCCLASQQVRMRESMLQDFAR